MQGGSWYLRSWLYAAAQAGWDAWALNLRGHHGSRPVRDLGRVSLLDYVEDVHDCLPAVKKVKAGTTIPARIETEETTFTPEQAKAALPSRKY